MRAFRRPVSVIAALGAAALLLTACGPVTTADPTSAVKSSTDSATSSTLPPAGDAIPAGLEKFYKQKLEWTKCGEGLECAKITVPMDYSKPEGETMTLAMNRLPGKDAQGSLLVNPGGPGGSGLDLVKDAGTTLFGPDLQRNFDIVGFDPRGVGSSTPVKCETPAEQDASRQEEFDTSTDAGLAILRKASAKYAEQCAQRTGPSLGFVDTVSAARDLDVMRALVGDKQLNYLGYSYGTYLGAHYAELFPHNVGRLVLDGALDPTLSDEEITFDQAVGFENEIRAYMQNCLDSGNCPFTGNLEEALTQLRGVLAGVERTPMVASDGRTVPINDFMNGFILPLYNNDSWFALTEAMRDVIAGNVDNIQFFADLAAGREEDGSYPSNGNAAFSAINCLDYPMNPNIEAMRAQERALIAAAPVFGKYVAFGAIGCQDWKYPPKGKPGVLKAAGAAPIVVVGTTGDPATPYKWAEALSEQLDSAVLVTFKGHGHTAYGRSNKCISDAVESYLIDGKVPADGLTC
ncbi:alpha/beta hydrolase [Paeniglutamicibacter sp. NPDC012692]|uniref:alpha/beta hydrolase n=1 Tax=Paeniglutamicibacter sp. NPDC012692 TaxID=3364388 RepID=UPI0036C71B54